MKQKHPVIPIYVGNVRAGLTVGAGVGQFVVVAERFAAVASADASGNVEFLLATLSQIASMALR